MTEGNRILGLGAAYVDAKVKSPSRPLPPNPDQLPAFLDVHPEASLSAGGSIPNIMTALVRLSPNTNARLFCCIGDDSRGRFFAEHTDKLLGNPQISMKNPTGIWVGVYDDQGKLVDNSDFYGAAGDITVSKEDLEVSRNAILITDIDACRVSDGLDSIKNIAETLQAKEDLFILSLSGTSSAEEVHKPLVFVNRTPDIVFGNYHELSAISHDTDVTKSIKAVFPTSKLVVITRGEAGSVIKFRDQFFSVPPKYLPKERIVDTTGVGDAFMGTMLAILLGVNHSDWAEDDIIRAAMIGSFSSALVIQNTLPRLTASMAQQVLDYKYEYRNS